MLTPVEATQPAIKAPQSAPEDRSKQLEAEIERLRTQTTATSAELIALRKEVAERSSVASTSLAEAQQQLQQSQTNANRLTHLLEIKEQVVRTLEAELVKSHTEIAVAAELQTQLSSAKADLEAASAGIAELKRLQSQPASSQRDIDLMQSLTQQLEDQRIATKEANNALRSLQNEHASEHRPIDDDLQAQTHSRLGFDRVTSAHAHHTLIFNPISPLKPPCCTATV